MLKKTHSHALSEFVVNGDYLSVKKKVEEKLENGTYPQAILDELIQGMEIIGNRFKLDEAYLPEVMAAARAMNCGTEILEPVLKKAHVEKKDTIVIGTVKNDLHDVGKNIVSIMFKGSGFNVIDLGVDVPQERFVEEIEKSKAQLVGISALLTTTLPQMEDTVNFIYNTIGKSNVIILVGGAPVTEAFAKKIGTNGYAKDAATGVDIAKKLINRKN
jgi:5-methyltetrahydrofolate--homocysteine methyltransferase